MHASSAVCTLRLWPTNGALQGLRAFNQQPNKKFATPQVCAPPGSSLHQVWQAVRASSAAPYYLDDFKCGADRCERDERLIGGSTLSVGGPSLEQCWDEHAPL